ncbi:transcriptional regulator HexR [Marinicellulosiphila megalodicopiae]|uniref:transcriptional regulator HexR n=1 Tax=Marinicellulosiphila megalodicopiae TaxID=2724896 RepID=UPI003BB14738
MHNNLINKLEKQLNELSKSEKKVGEAILFAPEEAIRLSIASLAKHANVSEPTVNRFCRSVGCSGFPDFKLQLAQSIATGSAFISDIVKPEDDLTTFTQKIFNASSQAIAQASLEIDITQMDKAIEAMHSANRIDFYGLGGSGPVAKDAVHKFFRLGTPVSEQTDILMQRMAAASSSKGDVIVFISNTGRTISVVECAEIAKQAGATIISLTQKDSPLAKFTDIVIHTNAIENTDIFTPMTSRLVHLTILDVLATGVIRKKGKKLQQQLAKIKESLSQTRY